MLNLYNLVNLNRRETGGKFQEPSRKKSAGSSFRAVPADFKSHLCMSVSSRSRSDPPLSSYIEYHHTTHHDLSSSHTVTSNPYQIL